jgi:hypothetical protein
MIEDIIRELGEYIKAIETDIKQSEKEFKAENKPFKASKIDEYKIKTYYETTDGKSFLNINDAENHQADINNERQTHLNKVLERILKETFGKIKDFHFDVVDNEANKFYVLEVVI